jgi:hypothetical protein
MARKDKYEEIEGTFRFKKGTTPDHSRRTDGALRATTRDAKGNLVGQAEFIPKAEDSSDSADYSPQFIESDADERAPDISSLMPQVLVAVAGIAAGVAGIKVVQHLRGQRETKRSQQIESASAGATSAGWYSIASDPTRLRYWDGVAWSDDIAQRQRFAPAIAADWYPDPANATQLRYWDGIAWSHHVTPIHGVASTPADWYPDPADATQLRYWDGATWTHHVTPIHGTGEVAQPIGAYLEKGPTSAHAEPRMRMTSAEWQAHVRAWMAAGAIQQELWRRLSTADIGGADPATLETQRQMEQLTAEQGAHRIRFMLEANPSLRNEFGLAEFMKMFGGNGVLAHEQQVGIERTTVTRRPRDGEE